MALKEDLTAAFQENLDNNGSVADVAKLVVDAYATAVDAGSDSITNKWSGVLYPVIESAIIAQLQLSFNTKTFLQFTLIEVSLIAAWAPALLQLPAIPPSGMSLVTLGNVAASTPVGTTPLVAPTSSIETVVDKFFNMFVNHAKTISFLYTGVPVVVPPPAISVPVSSFTII